MTDDKHKYDIGTSLWIRTLTFLQYVCLALLVFLLWEYLSYPCGYYASVGESVKLGGWLWFDSCSTSYFFSLDTLRESFEPTRPLWQWYMLAASVPLLEILKDPWAKIINAV